MSTVTDWLEDSNALCKRAQHHYEEFSSLIGRNARPSLWEIREFADDGRDTFTYGLLLNRQVLAEIKPVAADFANNLVHSLDQLIGASARLRGHHRHRSLYFPWLLHEEKFQRKLKELEVFIGTGAVEAIREVRLRHRNALPLIHAVKEVSNSGKHWELVPSSASAAAVAVTMPGTPQKIWEVPADAFDACELHEFAVGVPRMQGVPFEILISFRFEGLGLGDDVSAAPDNIFYWAHRYVRDIIEGVSGVPNWLDPSPAA